MPEPQPGDTPMRRLTTAELDFVGELITDAEGTAADVAGVLGSDNEAAPGLKGARDYLRAVRDTGMLCGSHLSDGAREVLHLPARTPPPPAYLRSLAEADDVELWHALSLLEPGERARLRVFLCEPARDTTGGDHA